MQFQDLVVRIFPLLQYLRLRQPRGTCDFQRTILGHVGTSNQCWCLLMQHLEGVLVLIELRSDLPDS